MFIHQHSRRSSIIAGAAGVLGAACGAGATSGLTNEAAGKGAKPGKFTLLNWWSTNHASTPVMDEVAGQWKTRRPDIELEYVHAPGAGLMREKFTTVAAAGSPVDASFMSIVHTRDVYDQGLLREIDSSIKFAPEVADDKYFKASEQFRKARGKTFGIPIMGPESMIILVNGNMFRAAGLDQRGKDIKTWDDLSRIAQQLTVRDGSEIKRSGYLINGFDLPRFSGWINSTGSTLFDTEQTKAFYSGQGAATVLEYLSRLHNGLRVSVPTTQTGRLTADKALVAGAGALVDDISSAPGRLGSAPADLNYWMIAYPAGPGGKGSGSVSWMNPMVFAKEARSPDQAFEFARWFCGSLDIAKLKLAKVDAASPLRALYQTPEWQSRVKINPVLQTIPEVADLGGVYPYRRTDEQNAQIAPLLREAFLSTREIKNALQQAQDIATRLLAQ